MKKSKRFEALAARPVNQDGFVVEWPEVGLIAMGSPNDPVPGIRIDNGKVVEMDGVPRTKFDFIDQFIADYAIDIKAADKAMAMGDTEIAKMLCDVNVPREEVVKVAAGLTPAKIVAVLNTMNVVEMMMALQKMRARKRPSNQCHVTNVTDNPVLIAADGAEASFRGFDEMETTVGVVRYAPFNALSLLIGGRAAAAPSSSARWKRRPNYSWACAASPLTRKPFPSMGRRTCSWTATIRRGQRHSWHPPTHPAA